jgi:(1->4)-alpha-D-glucan 1-alpha-D-glucosylmutase
MVKATREAMVHTKWARPNVRHEQALIHFIERIMKKGRNNAFLEDFRRFCGEICYYGALNSLAQLVVKITAPGVPDFYQGSELWDLRLVDPDNRGPVDFQRRVALLSELKQQEDRNRLEFVRDLLAHWQDGRIKLFVTARSLNFRRAHPKLFRDGFYEPMHAVGPKRQNVFAFVRRAKGLWAMTIVPRLVTKLGSAGSFPIGEDVWVDNALPLAQKAPLGWTNVFTGEKVRVQSTGGCQALVLRDVLAEFPVALLQAD